MSEHGRIRQAIIAKSKTNTEYIDAVVICAVITQGNGDVDTRVYGEEGLAIIGKDGSGEDYHLGQISSSVCWARHDIVKHFKDEYDRLFPNGWSIRFEYR